MTISPLSRLLLLVAAGILPVWKGFFTTSTDYSLRGLAMPILDALGIAAVIIIARTRNPLVDGLGTDTNPMKAEITNTKADAVPVTQTK